MRDAQPGRARGRPLLVDVVHSETAGGRVRGHRDRGPWRVPGPWSRGRHADVGAKARNLGWLAGQGLSVPPAVALPFDAVQAAFGARSEPVLCRLRAELRDWLDPDGVYAVRSSGEIEDGETRSFAGRFVSVLDVSGLDAVIEAMAAVAKSAGEAGTGGAPQTGVPDSRMAVIVQRMVPTAAAGVAFSKNPLTGFDEVVVEAVPGRGDALVQDGVTPDHWVHRWGDLVERPADPRTDAAAIEGIARETRRIARAFGRPVDVEWAHDGRQTWWLQVRPMTGLDGIAVYSNRIAREVLPGLVKPLVWSVNVPVVNRAWVELFTEAIGPNDIDPERLARAFGYRAYFDMTRIGDIFVALGMPRESLELLLGLPAGSDQPRFRPTAGTLRHLPRMAGLTLRLARYERRLERELPELEARYRAIAAEDVATMSDDALLDRVDRLMALTQEAAYANIVTPLLMNLYGGLVRRRSAALGVDPARVDPARGLSGMEDYDPRAALATLGAQAVRLDADTREVLRAGGYGALAAAAAADAGAATGPGVLAADAAAEPVLVGLRAGVDRFLERFGHLAASGNDFSVPRWREDPDLVVRMVLDAPATSGDEGLGWDALGPRTTALGRPFLRRIFRRAGAFRRHREAVSFLYTYGYGLFRPTFLELGRRLVAQAALETPGDVFLLTLDELRGAIAAGGGPGVRELCERRRIEMTEAAELDLPELILGDDFVPRHRGATTSGELRGVPSSRGTYRGPARVVHTPDEFDRVGPGDVLVIPFSDVAWTPLFARVGAVVAESGGMLSHSSIVAREHGIPCVVSVTGAMRVPDGTPLHVDGYRGIVTIDDAVGEPRRAVPAGAGTPAPGPPPAELPAGEPA
jgi:phosphohistidine swiveling domain-containing protein